jgi:hypothetical protein
MAECKGVDAVVMAVVYCSVVQETSYETTLESPLAISYAPKINKETYGSSILVNNESQPIELPNCVYAACSHLNLSILRIPYLQVPSTSLRSCCSEIDIHRPVRVKEGLLSPYGATFVARGWGREDQLVLQDIWGTRFAE